MPKLLDSPKILVPMSTSINMNKVMSWDNLIHIKISNKQRITKRILKMKYKLDFIGAFPFKAQASFAQANATKTKYNSKKIEYR